MLTGRSADMDNSLLKKLLFAREILSTRKTCDNCWHNHTGHCGLYSCKCVTQVLNRADTPEWWLSYEDGEEYERRILKGHRLD